MPGPHPPSTRVLLEDTQTRCPQPSAGDVLPLPPTSIAIYAQPSAEDTAGLTWDPRFTWGLKARSCLEEERLNYFTQIF